MLYITYTYTYVMYYFKKIQYFTHITHQYLMSSWQEKNCQSASAVCYNQYKPKIVKHIFTECRLFEKEKKESLPL